MDNFGIRLLEEKGILACNLEAILDGAKLFDKIHSLSKRHVPNQKGQLSLPLLYFGNSYNVGEKNYTLCARGGMIHQNHNLYTRRKELRECYCPRFIVVVFRLVDEETDIPQNKRSGKKLPKGNLCFMLRNMLLDAFDSDKKSSFIVCLVKNVMTNLVVLLWCFRVVRKYPKWSPGAQLGLPQTKV